MKRNPKLQQAIDAFSKEIWGRDSSFDGCVQCGSEKIKDEDFRNDISRKEFALTRWCQICQDKFFGHD